MLPEIERELVERSKHGDIEAFEKLIISHERKVFTIAYRYMGNRQDAEDLAQEAFLRAYRSIKNFRGDSSFSTWLYHIVTNVCIDALRKRSRANEESLDAAVSTEKGDMPGRQVADWSMSPELLFEKKEVSEHLQGFIDQLPPEYRSVIIMREIQEFSYEEIARFLGCSMGTVKSRLSRARKILRDRILKNRELCCSVFRLPQQEDDKR